MVLPHSSSRSSGSKHDLSYDTQVDSGVIGGIPSDINRLAILSLVLAFPIPIAGIVLGHVAKNEIRNGRGKGAGITTAGLAVGYTIVICAALLLGGLLIFAAMLS
jgi:hypothetical protein